MKINANSIIALLNADIDFLENYIQAKNITDGKSTFEETLIDHIVMAIYLLEGESEKHLERGGTL